MTFSNVHIIIYGNTSHAPMFLSNILTDVAAKAGVSLSQARKDLTALASLTQGDISVTTDGELIYNFPKNLNSALSSSSFKYKLVQLGRKAWPPLFYAIRVSFGVALLVSIFAIFSTIAFISASSSSSDDRDRRDRGGGSMFFRGNLFGPSPFDFFYYRPYYGSPYYKDPEEMGFLESTFSYIFGDGNPNQDIEERRLRLVSNMIRMNNGAVTAEQLAPFVIEDDIPKPDASIDDPNSIRYVDESFVLPIVTQLGGEPVVTEDGDIVYVFPEMQLSAQSNAGLVLQKFGLSENSPSRDIKSLLVQAGIDTGGALEKRDLLQIFDKNSDLFQSAFGELEELEDENLLEEREYEFSIASDTNKFLAGGLGAVNLGGALYLGNILGQVASLGVRLPSYYGVVQSFFPALLGYAILYNTIPIARNLWIKKENKKIRQRNRNRQLWKNIASSSVGRVKRKLKQAKSMGSRLKQLGASKDSVVFDTSDSMEDVNIKSEKSQLDDFDRLLGKE